MNENSTENVTTEGLERQLERIRIIDDSSDNRTEIEVDTSVEINLNVPSSSYPVQPTYQNMTFGETPLISATRANDVHAMTKILSYSSNINQSDNYGNTALHYAALSGFMDGVELLIQNHCNLNPQNIIGLSPLMEAVINHYTDVAYLLLDAGASPYLLSSSFESAITLAASKNYNELLYCMINTPSDPVLRKRSLDYAFVYAAKTSNIALADALLHNEAEIHLSLPNQKPLLNISAGIGDDVLATKWILAGANVDGRDHLGLTPLMHSAIYGHLSTCQILINNGANANTQYEGKSAMDMALEKGHEAVAKYLQSTLYKN